jgi:hypothetical protein
MQHSAPDHYIDHHQHHHRTKMLPIHSKYTTPATSSSNMNIRKSAIPTPPLRHDEMNYHIPGGVSKSPSERQESSYKIDNKMFTSSIGMSMRKDDVKEKMQPIEHEPPLEGLAASLRQHVIASMKIKEENEGEQQQQQQQPKYSTYPPLPYPHIIKKECK